MHNCTEREKLFVCYAKGKERSLRYRESLFFIYIYIYMIYDAFEGLLKLCGENIMPHKFRL